MSISYIGDIPNPSLRDFQRQRLYNAEIDCTFWNNLEILPRPAVKDLVYNIAEWAEVSPPTISYPSLYKNGGIAYATATSLVLPFPLSKSKPFICHEMAHVINYQRGPADHHGPNFASAYLEVVNTFIGKPEYKELRKSFDKQKVKYGMMKER